MSLVSRMLWAAAFLFVCHSSYALELNATALTARLEQNFTFKVESVIKDEDLGLYRVIAQDGLELFATLDGKHFIIGDKWRLQPPQEIINLSEREREKRKFATLARLSVEDMIVFPAKGKAKAWVVVFTDIDCGYCRTLHNEIERFNELGIEVRYAFFPRSGLGTPSYNKAVSVWCAENQRQAMTLAKQGKRIQNIFCDNPVQEQYEKGIQMGVKGTPSLFTNNGRNIPGYVPPADLAKILGI